MTIQSVEQALDSAIALLMYGSSAWLSYSLIAFIVTRPKRAVGKKAVEKLPSTGSISIEVMPEAIATDLVVEAAEVSPAEQPLPEVVPAVDRVPAAPVPLLPPAVVPDPAPLPIVCEPVNWKKWKVSELRQASITKVCGVRTSPIGSKRKLKKADLIAQYEQNLKRMTYEAGTVLQKSDSTDQMQSERIA